MINKWVLVWTFISKSFAITVLGHPSMAHMVTVLVASFFFLQYLYSLIHVTCTYSFQASPETGEAEVSVHGHLFEGEFAGND